MNRHVLSLPKAALLVTASGILSAGVLLSLSALGAFSQETPERGPPELFSAPSHLPAGEHWVLVGSAEELPADIEIKANLAEVTVTAVEKLSPRALAVRLVVPTAAQGNLLRAGSLSEDFEVELALQKGTLSGELTAPANFSPEDFQDGLLVVGTERFLYGFTAASSDGLAAVRIHNRQSGMWSSREYAKEEEAALARKAEEDAATGGVLPPHFVEVEERVTLPDTDGDGIPDFEEAPEPKEPEVDFLGVSLTPGKNLLDIVAVDRLGSSSWSLLEVFSTVEPAAE